MANFSSTYPSTRPVFNADFSNAGRLDNRISYSRSTTGSFYGKDKHLSSDNLLTYSENFGAWSQVGLFSRTGGQTDPAGGSTGFTLRENSSSGYHRNYLNAQANESFAFVVYAKQNSGTRYLCLTLLDTGNDWESAIFDLAGGAPTTVSGSSSGFTNVSATQTASGNGYYKCVLKATGYTNTANVSIHNSTTSAGINTSVGLPSYTGDGSSSIDVAFASLSSTGATDYNFTSGQIHREYAPTLQTAAINAPRFEHSASDSASMGLLIEGQSQNLISYSDDITNAWWGKVFVSDYSNAAVGPTGTLNADLIVPSAVTNSSHYLQKTGIATTVSTTYTYSLYVKSAGVTKFAILMFQNTSPYTQFGFASVDLGAGTINGTIGSGATIEAVGNGWHRVSVSGAALTTVSNPRLWFQDSTGNFTHLPNGYDGLLVAGQQFEAGQMSSLISTSGSQATRAADSAAVTMAAIGQNQIGNAVSAVAEFDTNASDAQYRRVMVLKSGDTGLRIDPQVYSGTGYVWVANTSGGTTELTSKSGAGTGFHKVAIGLDGTTANASFDGATAATMSNADTASVQFDKLQIGSYSASQLHLDGHIRNVSLYNVGLSATNVSALTK